MMGYYSAIKNKMLPFGATCGWFRRYYCEISQKQKEILYDIIYLCGIPKMQQTSGYNIKLTHRCRINWWLPGEGGHIGLGGGSTNSWAVSQAQGCIVP